MKIIAGLFLNKKIETVSDIEKYTLDVMTYVNYVDKLLIFNNCGVKQDMFWDVLSRFHNVEYTDCPNYGEVCNYKLFMYQAVKGEYDYAIPLELDYYYEEDVFLNLKKILKKIIEEKGAPAVFTPYPMYTCEKEKQTSREYKEIMGCHLVGAFINVKEYAATSGFEEIYYQTTFDYDYCLMMRNNGKHIYVAENEIIRNRNYRVLEKRILTLHISTYEIGTYQLYYETRNRHYLWNKYEKTQTSYVKKDKKLYRGEKKEMILADKMSREKRKIMRQAIIDYKIGKMGKAFEEISFISKDASTTK